LKQVLLGILTLILLVATPFIVGEYNLLYKSTIMKKSRNIDRDIYETSKSYVKGASQDLANYKFQYDKASEDERQAIAGLVRNRFSDLEPSQLKSYQLQVFLKEVRGY
jgi:hypothetical protein